MIHGTTGGIPRCSSTAGRGSGASSWSGAIAYLALILILRISGKRTLTKLNAFDLVVTVGLGSTLATIILSKDVPLAEGIAALSLLVALQAAITWLSVRWPLFERVVKSEPSLVLRNGHFLPVAMRRQRITRDEILSAIRASGGADAESTAAVVLETDGSISVISGGDGGAALATVARGG